MRIGFISLDYPSHSGGGGVGNQVRTIGQALVHQGHQVTVVALAQPGQPGFIEDGGVKVYRVEQSSLHWYLYKLPWLGRLLALAVRELEYGWAAYRQIRTLHVQMPFDVIEGTETGAFWVALLLKSAPLIIRLHGEQYTFCKYTPDLPLTINIRLSRLLQRMTIRRARLLTSPSQAHACEIAAELGQDHPAIEVIPNAVDLSVWDKHQTPQDEEPQTVSNQEGTNPVVLFVGRLERVKGVPILLAAARRVLEKMPNVRFRLIGAAHPTLSKADLEALLQRFSLNGQVQFVGHIPHQELIAWYQQADLCVLPSYYETFGLAALEPMVLGVPVVATRVGGLVEVVEDGVTGLLASPGDEQALAAAMIKLLQDKKLRTTMGETGQRRIQARFNLEQIVEKTLAVYCQVQSLS
jgi:glycosyltransferase involved in cell wall biosynthesis